MSEDRAERSAPATRHDPGASGPANARGAGRETGRGAGLGAAQLGLRVTVRRRLPPGAAAGATDVVGTLVVADADRWVVRERDGTDVAMARADVTAARVVPDPGRHLRRAADVDPAVLELIAARGWQPLEAERIGGWLLRAAGGFTGRANSVLPLGEPDVPLDDALTAVRRWYAERGLPARVQVPLPWARALDAALEARGWGVLTPAHVLVADVAVVLERVRAARARAVDATHVVVADRPDDGWLGTYQYRGASLPPHATDVLVRAAHPLFVTLRDADGPVAVGRGTLGDGWLGVTAVDVVARARRRGCARQVLQVLGERAHRAGVRFVYLQVADDNAAALTLYTSAGFTRHHDYHYRVQP